MTELVSNLQRRYVPLVIASVVAGAAYGYLLWKIGHVPVYVYLIHAVIIAMLSRPSVRRADALAGFVALAAFALLPYEGIGSPGIAPPLFFGALSGLGYWLFLPVIWGTYRKVPA